MRVLQTGHKKVERVAFAADGGHLFASGLHYGSLGSELPTNGIDVFDLPGGPEPITRLFTDKVIEWFAPLPVGRVAVVHSGWTQHTEPAVTLLDWKSGSEVEVAAGGWRVGGPCSGSSDGSNLLTVLGGRRLGRNNQRKIAFEAGIGCHALPGEGTPALCWQRNLGYDRQIQAVAFAADGRSFWTAELVVAPPLARPLSWWIEFIPCDANSGNAIHEPVAYPNQKISALALSPDGRFAVAHDGPSLFIYTLADLTREPKKLANPAKRKHLGGFAFHPSGDWLAAAGLDGAVTVWNTANWKVARSWEWGIGQARSICFSPDGNLAAIGTGDGRVVVWDLDL